MKIEALHNKAEDAIRSCLEEIPFLDKLEIHIESLDNVTRPDFRVSVSQKKHQYSIIVQVKNNGEPRHARQATNQLLLFLQESQHNYGIFVAPYISPRASEICRENGVGYLDLAGNCYISLENIYIHKTGKPNPFKREKYLRSLFTPKAERILRVLLNSEVKQWKFEELSNEAGVSLGQVSNVKKLLVDQEWLNGGFLLKDPAALLNEWAKNYQFRKNKVHNYYSLSSPAEIEAELGKHCQNKNIPYGLTGFSGSVRIVPAVRYQRVMAYVQTDMEKLADKLDFKPVSSGANVLLLEPYDDGVFYGMKEKDGDLIVSSIQIYLDLMSYHGRGEEAAEVLYDKVITEIW